MWKKPENIPPQDWQELTQEWMNLRDSVYNRFHSFDPEVKTKDIDGIMSGLLRLYYTAEHHAQDEASFAIQLSDEFHKGFWVEGKIKELEQKYPKLREPHTVRYQDEFAQGTVADKCMGGIVAAFIDITRTVCTERFGKPFGDNEKALRNGVLERSSWGEIMEDYAKQYGEHREALRTNPHKKEPPIYRH